MKLIITAAAFATVLSAGYAMAQSSGDKSSCMVPIPGTDVVSVSKAPECSVFRSEPDDPKFREPAEKPDCYYLRRVSPISGSSVSVESLEAPRIKPCYIEKI